MTIEICFGELIGEIVESYLAPIIVAAKWMCNYFCIKPDKERHVCDKETKIG